MSEESTTPDLVELNRRLVEAWNRRDIEAVMSFFASDAVWDRPLAPGDERLRGRTAIRGWLEESFRPYEEWAMEVEELLDLGKGVSFSVAVQKGRLVGSSGFLKTRLASVVVRDGDLIVRIESYLDIDEARAAAERLAEERG
jgi:ketosteroid isomerase-like protein